MRHLHAYNEGLAEERRGMGDTINLAALGLYQKMNF